MIRPNLPLTATATLTALLVLSGCSSGSGDGKSADPGAASVAGNNAAGAAPTAGSDGQLAVPERADEQTKKEYAIQNAIASCMRQAGFPYVAYVPDPGPQNRDDFDRDYEASRKNREKYGFGAFAAAVYPDDLQAPGAKSLENNDPNSKTYQALAPDQKRAWDTAMMGTADTAQMKQAYNEGKGCEGGARVKVYGDEKKIKADSEAQAEQARRNRQNLNGDPELVRLAQGYASCLRTKGFPVNTTAVTEIRSALRFEWFGKYGQLEDRANGGAPPTSSSQRSSIDPAQARTMLTQEIQAALADLDCGREFRAAYYPKLDKAPGAEGQG